MSDFDAVFDDLAGDANFGFPVVFIPRGGSPIPTVALLGRRDVIDDLGQASVEQNVLEFMIARADVPAQPGRGDGIEHANRLWRISGPAEADPTDRVWLVRAARLAA